MRAVVSGKEMKAIDRRSIEEFGIPSMVLMERAALAVADEAWEFLKKTERKRVCAVCGFGNNGADGIAAVRILKLRGADGMILLAKESGQQSKEFETQLAIARRLSIPVCTLEDFIPGSFDLILDAVFGIGLSRNLEGVWASMTAFIMEQKEKKKVPVLAVDLPSGISSDTGVVMGTAVFADVTVTFGEKKIGQTLFPGRTACGRLVIADIGFVPETEEAAENHVMALKREDLSMIPGRRSDSNKGTWGKVLVIAGSRNMAGAAYFSALGAYKCGAGLVKILTVEENRQVLQDRLPEAILSVYDREWAGERPEELKEYIREQTRWADVIVLGPGIGTEPYVKTMVEAVLEDAYVPIILDADAINLAAEWPYLKGYFTENIIVTPHMREMERLTEIPMEELKADPIGAASEFAAQYGLTCVLKDAATVTARKDGKIFINESGSPAMAKGGSGDVLTGVIAGLIAIGMDDCDAAALGVYVHGLAGEAAEKKFGAHSVLAGELAACLGEVLRGESGQKEEKD